MSFLHIVTWKWGTTFGPEYVNKLQIMLKRHLSTPHQLHCITDDPAGIDDFVLCHPMYSDHGAMTAGNRACFRRLRIFDKAMREQFGPRILQLDLDIVITGDMTPVFDRPEPLVLCWQGTNPSTKLTTYNPSMLLMDAGVMHEMWENFNARPHAVWAEARKNGWRQSDMSIINNELMKGKIQFGSWNEKDGIYTYWRDLRRTNYELPADARAVLFYGKHNPGDAEVLSKCPWVSDHWR